MTARIAINGFGRIGRAAYKIALEKPDVEIVAINDLTDPKILAHLLKYDTAYGKFQKEITLE
ncbi:MAG: Glyceraldehyde-3-phosphate dehydrogenase, type I, partial [candidate division WWE3 bacterium GW2011_GWC1_41_7]